jgi:hypothetical protein
MCYETSAHLRSTSQKSVLILSILASSLCLENRITEESDKSVSEKTRSSQD